MAFFSASVLVATTSLLASRVNAQAGVIATGTMGPTNPPQATLGLYNQTGFSRLASVNSYDDFCLWGPPSPGADSLIGNTEAIEVAWCTKPRNGARVIPDGVFTAIHFVKTPLYVQVQGYGDFTKLNVPEGDQGGELDPHGATGEGNPVGGNVTSNAVTGSDTHYEEWTSFMSANQFCFRICTAQNATYSAAIQCQHEIDLLGCEFVLPGDYSTTGYTSCDGDSAYPPGVYPIGGAGSGTTSTFHQRFTYTDGAGTPVTIGVTVTPTAAFSIPASSNCVTHTSPSNGLTALVAATSAAVTTARASSAASMMSSGMSSARTTAATGSAATALVASAASGASTRATASATTAASSASSATSVGTPFSFLGALVAAGAAVIGGAAILL